MSHNSPKIKWHIRYHVKSLRLLQFHAFTAQSSSSEDILTHMTVVVIVGTFHVCAIRSRRSKVFCKFRFGQRSIHQPLFYLGWSWNQCYSVTQTWLMHGRTWTRTWHTTQGASTTTSFEIVTCRLLLFLLLLLTLLSITCMQGIYNYIPKQTTFLGYKVLQLFCIYNLCYM